MTISVPPLREGRPALIRWAPDSAGSACRLERRTGGGFDSPISPLSWDDRDSAAKSWAVLDAQVHTWERWEASGAITLLYEGKETSFLETVPHADQVEYRVTAAGGTAKSGVVDVKRGTPPALSGEDADLGGQYKSFPFSCTVTGTFEDSALQVEVLLDGEPFASHSGVGQILAEGSVGGERLEAMEPGSQHVLLLRAVDDLGLVSERRLTFSVLEDLRRSSTYYLLRDGVPITKSDEIKPFFDYAALGPHRYRVRAVDRFGSFRDSNEVEITSRVECTVLAPLEAPEKMIPLRYRLDERPEVGGLFSAGNRLYPLEGREIAVDTGRDSLASRSLTVSVETPREGAAVRALAESGGLAVYRDPFENRAIVSLDRVTTAFHPMGADLSLLMTELEEGEAIPYD